MSEDEQRSSAHEEETDEVEAHQRQNANEEAGDEADVEAHMRRDTEDNRGV